MPSGEKKKLAKRALITSKTTANKGHCGTKLCIVLAAFFFVGVAAIIAIVGIWSTPHGRIALHSFSITHRTGLNLVPESERGFGWAISSLLLKLALELPGFIVGFKGDRAVMYAVTAELTDHGPASFRDSFVLFKYGEVASMLNSAEQPRKVYLGAASVPSKCMGNDTLIFLSTGPTHTALRELLVRNVPSFVTSDARGAPLVLDYGEDAAVLDQSVNAAEPLSDSNLDRIVRRTLIRTMFKVMFEAPGTVDEDTLAAFEEYATWGGTCVLGADFHHITGGLILDKVDAIRARIRKGVLATPVGQRVKAAASVAIAEGRVVFPESHTVTEEDRSGDSLVRQLADGAAFAGMLGTTHLTTHALDRIRSDPSFYRPLFDSDPVAFLHEEARVDPPVTSITAVLKAELRTKMLGPGGVDAVLPAGTPHQLAIYTANVDPEVFGGAFHGKGRALEFDPSRPEQGKQLSWNGRLDQVKDFKAPRGCPGYRLSMALAKSVVHRFAPPVDGIHRAVPPESRAAASVPSKDKNAHFQIEVTKDSLVSTVHALDRGGFLIWLMCTVGAAGFLLGKAWGPVSIWYMGYLLAQSFVAIGFLLNNQWLFVQSQLLAAVAYMLLFTACRYADDGYSRHFFSSVVWVVWAVLSLLVNAIFIRFGYVEAVQNVSNAFYSIGACCGLASIFTFWWRDAHGDAQVHASRLGLLGGFFGIADLSPLVLFRDTHYAHLLSRILDSALYVPLVVPAVLSMNNRYFPNTSKPTSTSSLPRMLNNVTRFASVIVLIMVIGTQYIWRSVNNGNICAWEGGLVDQSILSSPLCTSSPLSDAPPYGRVMFNLVKATTNYQDPANEHPSKVLLPRLDVKLPKIEAIAGTGWMIPSADEDNVYDNFTPWLSDAFYDLVFNHIMTNTIIFPLHDNPRRWDSLQQAHAALTIAGGLFLPSPNTEWAGVDKTSDEGMSRMIFSGYGGTRVQLVEGEGDVDKAVFKVDLSSMASLDVRPGFARFGAAAFFDKNKKLIRMTWSAHDAVVYPSHPNWEHVKYVFRCSLILSITATEHLMNNHLIFSNLASTASRENLPKDHPIRRFLKPFNHRTPSINVGASQLLTRENGLLHRATSLTSKGLSDALIGGLGAIRFTGHPMKASMPVLEFCRANNVTFPYAEDGIAFYAVVLSFVTKYIDIYYPTDESIRLDEAMYHMWKAMRVFRESSGLPLWHDATKAAVCEVIAFYVFEVTGMHAVVGNVAEYLTSPAVASARIRDGSNIADVESSQLALMVALLTGLKAPKLMNNFEHLLLHDDNLPRTSAVLRDFQSDLLRLAEELDVRNAARVAPFYGFDPRRMLSSVSI